MERYFLTLFRERVDGFVGEAPQFDDLTMMCFSYNGSWEEEEIPETPETPDMPDTPEYYL